MSSTRERSSTSTVDGSGGNRCISTSDGPESSAQDPVTTPVLPAPTPSLLGTGSKSRTSLSHDRPRKESALSDGSDRRQWERIAGKQIGVDVKKGERVGLFLCKLNYCREVSQIFTTCLNVHFDILKIF